MKIFSRFGNLLNLTHRLRMVFAKLYFSNFIQNRSTIFTQRSLLVIARKIFFRSSAKAWKSSRALSVTRTHSAFTTWLQGGRGLGKLPLFLTNRLLPSRKIVNENYSPLKVNSVQGFSVPLIVYIPFILLYVFYGQRPHALPLVGGLFPSPTPTPFLTHTPTTTPTSMFTPTPKYTPAYVLPSTLTPVVLFDVNNFQFITDRGDYYKNGQRFLFSYYFPDLGGVNCHEDNWVGGQCKNITASKVVGWREYLGKGVAVHSDTLQLLPYGSTFYVLNPPSIAGFYTVVDLCCGCKKGNQYYLDFLFPSMPSGVDWSYNVDLLISRIGWDGSIPVDIRNVSCADETPTPFPSSIPTQTPYIVTVTPQASSTPVFTASPTSVPFDTATTTP